MPFSITVSNLETTQIWVKQLTPEEYKEVKDYVKGRCVVGLFPALFKPVRTNNLKNFAADFFLPTVINHALRVENTVGKIFAILGALILDTVTFPIRLITCIPRIIYNACQKENLLKKYLIKENVNPILSKADHVVVKLQWEQQSKFPTSCYTTLDGTEIVEYKQERHELIQNINFIEIPSYPYCELFSKSLN